MPTALATMMAARLYTELRRHQYHISPQLQSHLHDSFHKWFRSCVLAPGGLRLRAELRPREPLCLYLHGAAGSGKSSIVRALLPALGATVRAFLQ